MNGRSLLIIPLLCLSGILQSTVSSHMRFLGVSPDLVLLGAVSWVLLGGAGECLLVGLTGGLVLDGLSGAPIGTSTISLLIVCYLAGLGAINVSRGMRSLPFIVSVLATGTYYGSLTFLLQGTGRSLPWGPTLTKVVLPAMLLNLLAMPLVYACFSWINVKVSPKRAEWQ